jgi:polysaccharide export outer membrane protein
MSAPVQVRLRSATRWRLLALLLGPAVAAAAPTNSAVVARETVRLRPPAPPAAADAPSAPYRLGVGDQLAISVYGEDQSLRVVPVDPSGRITYALVGTVQAAGRMIDELRADLQTRISKELRHGIVTVVPARFGSQTFTILGLVSRPGTYPIVGRMRVLDGIGAAGGLRSGYFRNSTVDLFDLRHATLLRRGETVPVDFEALITQGDASHNVELQSGDILTVPSALVRSVYVLGEVFYPRTVGFMSQVTLLQALTEGRGLKPTASGKLAIVRGSLSEPSVTVVDVQAVLSGAARDVQLAPGDIVYAPRRSMDFVREMVEGAVKSFATMTAGEAGSQLYRHTRAMDSSSRTVVVP